MSGRGEVERVADEVFRATGIVLGAEAATALAAWHAAALLAARERALDDAAGVAEKERAICKWQFEAATRPSSRDVFFAAGALAEDIARQIRSGSPPASDRPALEDAVSAFLASEDIAKFEKSHRFFDRAFAKEVPQYEADCARITATFDALREALARRRG